MAVFVIQKQMRFDHEKQELVERFPSVHKAERFGRLQYLLAPQATPFKTESAVEELYRGLMDFSDRDYLLLIGNPALIGMATSTAAQANEGRVKFLQWSGRDQDYAVIDARLF